MIKVYPHIKQMPSIGSNSTLRRESYTIWMKSLLFHGCGCTVFDSNGEILYRIDNYNKKCNNKVFLMNLQGKVLFSLQRKKLHLLKIWDGFKWSGSDMKGKAWFRVREDVKIFSRSATTCHVTLGSDKAKQPNCYKIIGFPEKSQFKIIRGENQLVAEVKRKKSSTGVLLGEDVLSLVMEPSLLQEDHLLIMALVAVYGLINNKL